MANSKNFIEIIKDIQNEMLKALHIKKLIDDVGEYEILHYISTEKIELYLRGEKIKKIKNKLN
jgi:hypothetical protein